jgi:hypothetical protein
MSEPSGGDESGVAHNLRALLGWMPYAGCLAAGVTGLVGAWQAQGSNAGGLYLIGGALAFGLLVNAILRR